MSEASVRGRVIVALDTGPDEALRLAGELEGHATWMKVGMTLFDQAGPSIVTELRGMGFEVFLDLKLHDIPHQVRGAAEAVSRLGARMLTVHALGGAEMIAAAAQGAAAGAEEAGATRPAILAVTVLTSMDDAGLESIGIRKPASEQVPLLASLALEAGADGIVCSPHEAAAVRGLAQDRLLVTPGVRPAWAVKGDQARVTTPAEALRLGASHLVIGRPITAVDDVVASFERIVTETEKELFDARIDD